MGTEIDLAGVSFEMGPACEALAKKSTKLLNFALNRAMGQPLWKCPLIAGYTTRYDVATQRSKAKHALTDSGWQVSQRPDVQAAMHEIVQSQLKGVAGRAVKVIEHLAFGSEAPPAVRLKAAVDLANRAGHAAVQSIAVDHTHRVEKPLTLEDLYRQAGLEMPDAVRQLSASNVVDAEFEPAPSTAGLEDLFEIEPEADPVEAFGPDEKEEPEDYDLAGAIEPDE